MMSDLNKLIEATNENTTLNEEEIIVEDNVIIEEVINEEIGGIAKFVQNLNESFNNEEITEEEYYQQLEEGLGSMMKKAFGVGTDDKADEVKTLAQRKLAHREKMRNAKMAKQGQGREDWQSGRTPEGRRLEPTTGTVTNPRGQVIKKKTQFSGAR
jgi:hypothetical protein